ncbi:alpha-L-fucosidase [Clostridium grantii]|uniref:alpha-L-fucosidase n=1 Tax=Clostridium grantii DSM 8605 TaxID=1121316 RepID=A0A1M5WEV9_9CLOT|nr:alpha-L-fucosidase [Clostridium grantii]SHH86089.1 alpha-L-fucosidase [Clostridium grantii DSM 8605]
MKDFKQIRAELLSKDFTIGEGPFEGTYESLKQYKCPKWFSDAKFGIWAHWGPQSVPRQGDWYARNMYLQGNKQYNHHLENYGHPSQHGYKDIIPLWKAENFDPDYLVKKYKKAGAKYFVSLAVHVDNFDCWDSTYQRWNSIEMGPRKNIVGMWEKAARENNLKFGVTEHLSNYHHWFGPSKSCDKHGELKNIPYDGTNPDNSDLYFSTLVEKDIETDWFTTDDTSKEFIKEWFFRMKDLLDKHKPDLMYIDGGVPFGDVGKNLMAYFYNNNLIQNNGFLDGVFNIKKLEKLGEYVKGIGVFDVERGVAKDILDEPWQLDTCIGNWFYQDGFKYKSALTVIEFLVDTVSKNGNLLLNIPLLPDGTLDAECEEILESISEWMAVNGEAIYETHPWKIYGEGVEKTVEKTSCHNESSFGISSSEFRFTAKEDTLNIFSFDWPSNKKIIVKSLKTNLLKETIMDVSLLGYNGQIQWKQDTQGLHINLPDEKPCNLVWTFQVKLA